MKAIKANKEYDISSTEIEKYYTDGYDIYEGGKLIRSGKGKSVPLDKYNADISMKEAKIAKLKKELVKAEKAIKKNPDKPNEE